MKKWEEMITVVNKTLEISKSIKKLDNVIFVGQPIRTPKIEEMPE